MFNRLSSQPKPNPSKITIQRSNMFSPLLFRFSKPNSCLVLLFFLTSFHHLACALRRREGLCDTLFRCGNLTAGFPFSGEDRPESCGHPFLVLHCNENKTTLIISSQVYRVLQINNSSNTLRLARNDFLGESFCSATFTSTTVNPELFQLKPDYTTLFVYYGCNPRFQNPANFTCPNIGVASVHRDNNYLENCGASFNIIVPKSYVPEGESWNVTNFQSVIKEGFEVKLRTDERPCQECKSTGGFCAYRALTPVCCKINLSSGSKCISMIPSGSTIYESHIHCTPWFRCGKQTDLYYPFWTADREECGHPEFKVNCSGEFAEFTISFVKFQILELNYESRKIRLARMDYLNNLCPQDPESALINQHVLPFSNNTELLTFFYHCPSPSVDFSPGDYFRQLQCGDTTDEQSYFVRKELSSSYELVGDISNELRSSCKRTIDIPVSRSALKTTERNQSLETLKKALDKGFELRFNKDCSRCLTSGGACGYNLRFRKFICYCIDDTTHNHTCGKKGISNTEIGIGLACGILGVTLVTGCLRFMIRKRGTSQHQRDRNLKALVNLTQYSYAEVKKITKSFSHTVGKGGFGTVYGGNLSNGRKVAVKILKDFKSNGEDFINEITSMSQTSHVNIVSLLGFCYEGSKRAIVYEFLENGSLDQFISKKNSLNLDVSTLYRIALGVARGLEYLHHGCRTRIVHFDIKPQNVLLDDNLCPKVSDFGLAKLCEKRESILSLLDARGTIGYIAPEVFSGLYGRISHKSDVYSYGMLVLEMIGVKNKETEKIVASNSSSTYFPDCIYKDLENGEHTSKFGDDISREEKEIAKKMTLVGLWCIQPCPSNRPPMNRVVEMMEGSLDALEVPPKPSLHLSAEPLPESSSLSEESSKYSEVLI